MNNILTDIEAEMRVLGGALVSLDWTNDLIAMLKVEHFADERNRIIFAAIKDLAEADQEVNMSRVMDLTSSKLGVMDHVLDVHQIGSIRTFHFQVLKDALLSCYFKRTYKNILGKIYESMDKNQLSEDDILKSLDEDIQNIHGDFARRKSSRNMADILNRPVDQLKLIQETQERFRKGEEIYAGLPTGYPDLDKMINSLRPGHLMVIGARPSVGKTTFATNLIENISLKFKEPSLFISLEMPASEVTMKLLCQTAEVSEKNVKKGDISGSDYQRLVEANEAYKKRTIIIEDQPGLTIEQIKMRATRAKKAHGIKLIVIDYLQLISAAKRTENRQVEVSHISKSLKELAKTLEVPIIALAQLNRNSEQRESHSPMMSDLRESGGIEADADEVLLLHRPDMYESKNKPGVMQVFVVKNRFGETGMFQLNFLKNVGRLENYDKYQKPEKW